MVDLLNDCAGWLLIPFSFLIVTIFREFQKDGRVTITVWFVLAFHHYIALTNAYSITAHGVAMDAASFHMYATNGAMLDDWSHPFGLHANVYIQSLGQFYKIFGSSLLFGNELSILAITISCVVLVKLINMLDLKRYRIGILLLYGLLPSKLIYTSITMREPFQLLFFMLSVYWGLRYYFKPTIGAMALCVLFGLAMGSLHIGLVQYLVVIFPLLFIRRSQAVMKHKAIRLVISKRLIIGVTIAFLLVAGLLVFYYLAKHTRLNLVASLDFDRMLSFVENFRGHLKVGTRASYIIPIDRSSFDALALSMFRIVVYFLFAPFPWQIYNALDVYAMLESLLRFLLIAFSISAFIKENDVRRRSNLRLLLILYFSLTFIWALGTSNYGTSIRHHLVGYWIIIMLGGPGLIRAFKMIMRAIMPSGVELSTRHLEKAT